MYQQNQWEQDWMKLNVIDVIDQVLKQQCFCERYANQLILIKTKFNLFSHAPWKRI